MKPEGNQRGEIERATLSAFTQTFIPRFDRYAKQRADGTYVAINQMLTLDLVLAHLVGKMTLGAYALDTHSRARWICFDADDAQEWRGLLGLAQTLRAASISVPSYLEPSRRGGHLWLFLNPLPAQEARRLGKQLLKERQLEAVELYPKQDALRTGPGSLVRLPLGIHRLTNRRYHFVDLSGESLAPTVRAQVEILARPQKVPPEFVESVLSRAPTRQRILPSPRFTPLPQEAYGGLVSERIKHRISVYDFVSQFVQLDRGNKGLCPFHDDHRESFAVNVEANYWHCFAGCGGGSIIDFWMKWRALNGQDDSFKATCGDLAHLLGL